VAASFPSRRQVELIQSELGLAKRRFRSYSFAGTYRGFDVKVSIEGADEAGGGSGTYYRFLLDPGTIGPPGFRRLGFFERPRRGDQPVRRTRSGRYTANSARQLDLYVTILRMSLLEITAANREFTRVTISGPMVSSAAKLRRGLDRATARIDELRYAWPFALPDHPDERIELLYKLLDEVPDAVDRHEVFTLLEKELYAARERREGALDQYDAVVEKHHRDLADGARAAMIARHGALPVIATYRQASIRRQKAGDWQGALEWAERGLAMYGEEAADARAVDDLHNRARRARTRLANGGLER
jgi:tetratricopeptide (TPR) repeat protein